ncbi:hypothetical protein Lpp225_1549 [Lacticaseibacillus paracasei subsp. paracasei Lpp225]|uniref:Uncharacterized protein n=1 Tax=Lacticaseibacillus paracasei subsp. paracasei Lpp225 TaxID=1256225 RepID=S2NSC0_LACPA|nr:hypothetical protein Lpp225_1549 [Lacticaseibacillus paracasei subsp. paracasei Lpp225]
MSIYSFKFYNVFLKNCRVYFQIKKAPTHADDRMKQSIEMSRRFLKDKN